MTKLEAHEINDLVAEARKNPNTGYFGQYYTKYEADKYIAELQKEIRRCQEYHDKEAVKWLAETQKLKEKISELEKANKPYELAIFHRMISRYEYSSGFGTNAEYCIEEFASKITFDHSANSYWKVEKDGKTIAREATYLGQ